MTISLRRFLFTCATVLSLSFAVNAAELANYSVAQLLEPCVEGDNDSREGAAAETECEQYMTGFTDAYVLMMEAAGKKVCLPSGANRPDEVRWAFTKWVYKNYDDRGMPAAQGLQMMIEQEFACTD